MFTTAGANSIVGKISGFGTFKRVGGGEEESWDSRGEFSGDSCGNGVGIKSRVVSVLVDSSMSSLTTICSVMGVGTGSGEGGVTETATIGGGETIGSSVYFK
jgi:hypothetical protein